MNQGFFALQEERQQQIINAGFYVFANSEYKKAPVAEIAACAGISKALLFYHFKNKLELYLFLWEQSIEITRLAMKKEDVLGTNDFFEMMRRSLTAKCNVMEQYPYLSEFSLRAYHERNEEVCQKIQQSFQTLNDQSEKVIFDLVNTDMLRDDIDLHAMYQEMVWAADGYLHMAVRKGSINASQIHQDFERLIRLWETVYQK